MAGLRRGYMFDDWHGTKKYYPPANKEIEAGLETYQELQEGVDYWSYDDVCTCDRCQKELIQLFRVINGNH